MVATIRGGLKLLSLDGGGVRTLSELYILREVLYRVQVQEGLEAIPRPCDYFDMIGGTGIGGLFAIMLGRCCLSIDDIIRWVGNHQDDIISTFTHPSCWSRRHTRLRSNAVKLEKLLQDAIREITGNAHALMMTHNNSCKTFVCAMPFHRTADATPVVFRTYKAKKHPSFNCMIWEAARATSIDPAFFDNAKIGPRGMEEEYGGTSIGCNNPANIVLMEAETFFGKRAVQNLKCFISIGSGYFKATSLYGDCDGRLAQLEAVASDCEGIAREMSCRFEREPNPYFRFNVEQGMQDIAPEAWEKMGQVATHAEQYLKKNEVDILVEGAAAALSATKVVRFLEC